MGIQYPNPSKFKNAPFAINSYKTYVRENLANNIRETEMQEFIKNMEKNKQVQSLYNTMGYFNELHGLENQCLQLRSRLSFVPFHESLLNRIVEYSKIHNESSDHTKVLRFIYATTLGKISNLRNFRNHILIIDLMEYLELAQKNIMKMEEIEGEVSIDGSRQQYENALMDKIVSAVDIIKNQVIPALLQYFSGISEGILKLITEIIKRPDGAKKEQEELQNEIRKLKVASALKTISTFAIFLGKIGRIVAQSSAVSAEDFNPQVFQWIAKALGRTLQSIIDVLKAPFRLYYKQLYKMHSLMTPMPCFDNVGKITSEYMDKIHDQLENDVIPDSIQIKTMRDTLRVAIQDADCGTVTNELININNIKDIDETLFDKIKEYSDQLKEYAEKEKGLQKQLGKWESRLMEINKIMMSMFSKVQTTIISIEHGLSDKTQVELNVNAWQVQIILEDLKEVLRKMSEETEITSDLERGLEKISSTLDSLIQIYDRIQSYLDQAKFSNYLTNIQSPSSLDFTDLQLKNMVLQLKKMIQTNEVMDQYEIAIHSFKQHFHLLTFIRLHSIYLLAYKFMIHKL